MQNMSVRKKPVCLSIEEKLKIVERIETGEVITDIAADLGVHATTLYRIQKKKEDIINIKNALENTDGNMKKKRHRGVEESELENKLYTWLRQERAMGVHVTGPIIQKKALNYNERLDGDVNFKASNGWLSSFKKRHGIQYLTVKPTDSSSADSVGSQEFKEKFKNLVLSTGVKADAIYNCDEIGLYWKSMPMRTISGKQKKTAELRNKKKDRITVMACTNASGTHKLKLFVIGNEENPGCFKNVRFLPVEYKNEDNSLMDQELMMAWFNEVFVPEVKRRHGINHNSRKKIILIMDNGTCHPQAANFHNLYDFINVIFLPLNATSAIQPLRQGIIETFKNRYRCRLLSRILVEDTPEDGEIYLRSFNLLSCIYFCAFAWHDVTINDVRNGWRNLIPFESNPTPSTVQDDVTYIHSLINRIPRLSLITYRDTQNWLREDQDENGWRLLSDEDILFGVEPEDKRVKEEEEESLTYDITENMLSDEEIFPDSNNELINNVTTKEALKGITDYIRWYEKNINSNDLLMLRTLYDCQNIALDRLLREKE